MIRSEVSAVTRLARPGVILSLIIGCSAEEPRSPAEYGEELFVTKQLSPSSLNNYACATCHSTTLGGDALIRTGASLAGAIERKSFWGGQENDLLRSINACRFYFMVAPEPLAPEDSTAGALYAFLSTLSPGSQDPEPFTVVREIDPVQRGDAASGDVLYARACAYCHGAQHSGAGRLSSRVPILPEDTLEAHINYTPRDLRLAVTEKIRHGLFLGYGGDMPPFSREKLSDEQLSDVLESLGILGE